jgi:antiviral helicase SKI2
MYVVLTHSFYLCVFSMLYRGADLIRDIEWVVFDEVHYVNDSERGVVWYVAITMDGLCQETIARVSPHYRSIPATYVLTINREEVIIMLPSYVNLIFLSATTPNTLEFSDWIGRTKRKPVHVIKTDYRPVPLSHHLWANLKLHKVMQGKSGFLDKGYKEASNALQPSKDADKKDGKGKTTSASSGRGPSHLAWQAQGNKNNWMSLIRYLVRETLTPTVVFSFSKKVRVYNVW